MNNSTIKEIRRYLLSKLEKYEGKPVLLELDSNILKKVLFDYDNDTNSYKLIKSFDSNQNDDVDIRKLLQKIDFSNVSFDKVNISEFDFTDFKGVKINPQTIYLKNLRGTKLSGVEFVGPFDGCNINYADFTGSIGAVINPQSIHGKFMSNVKFNSVTFDGLFDGVYITRVYFAGSNGAVINPETLCERNLEYSSFSDVTFEGSFNAAKIVGADFTGSKGAIINPQLLEGRLIGANLCDVTLVGEGDIYKGVCIKSTSFKGAKGNLTINPQTVDKKDLRSCDFLGVTFEGPFYGCFVSHSNYMGSKGAVINPQEVCGKDISYSMLMGVHIDGPLYDVLVVKTDFTGSTGAVINPQLVRGKSINGAILTDVIVVEDFYDVDICDTIFDGVNFVEPAKKKQLSEEEKQKIKCINMIKRSFSK